MLIALLLVAGIALLIGVVVLWRATPSGPTPDRSDDDAEVKTSLIDVTPGGPGGGS
jgi:hypothetical protein